MPRLAPAIHPLTQPMVVGFRERLLRVVLFVTVLTSCVAFVEPSPHDFMVCLLLIVAGIVGMRFERLLLALFLPLLIWNIGGLFAVFNVANDNKAIQYAITSLYLATAAMLFTCVLAHNTAGRIDVLRKAYVLAALLASIAGIVGYFRLVPGAVIFTNYGRALGFFKDPNVFGPYLIWPALIVTARMLINGIGLRGLGVLGVLLFALLLSFSRGAWIHFGLSTAVMMVLLFVSARDPRFRMRLITFTVGGIVMTALLLVVLLSFDSIRDMFLVRANALNEYDTGQGGRFQLQELALSALLDFPIGMGPFEFSRVYGLQQHNVYLQAFIVYGWVGGVAYFVLLAATVLIGLRSAMVATPWQPYLIASLATFIGLAAEGMVIDTDHWRHFFLILGLVWGLSAATRRFLQAPSAAY